MSTGLGKKAVPRLREWCRQSQAEVVSNSRNKIHQTWGPPIIWALYDQWCGDKWSFLQRAINCVWLLRSRMARKTWPFIAAARVQTLYHAFYRHLLGITPLSDPLPLCTKQCRGLSCLFSLLITLLQRNIFFEVNLIPDWIWQSTLWWCGFSTQVSDLS